MLLNDKNGKFQCPKTYFFLLIGTSDGYSSDGMSVAPEHGNSNDNGTVTTHSVAADDPSLDNDEMFNDPFAMPCSPDLASFSSSPEDENIEKQNRLLFYPFTPNMSEHRVMVALFLSLVKNTMYLKNTWQNCSAWPNNLICQKGSLTTWWQNITSLFEKQARAQL